MTYLIKKAIKLSLWLLILAFIVVAALLGLSPKLLSHPKGREFLLNQVNQRIMGKLDIEEISLNWIGDQRLKGITLLDPQDRKILEIDDILIPRTLSSLLIGYRHEMDVILQDPHLEIIINDDETSNLQRALSSSKTSETPTTAPTPRHSSASYYHKAPNLKLKIYQGFFSLTYQNLSPINFKDINVDLAATESLKKLDIKVEALTNYGAQTGSLIVNGNFSGSTLSQRFFDANFNAQVDNLPLEGIDSLVSLYNPKLRGLLTALLGDQLNAKLVIQPNAHKKKLFFNCTTPTLKANFSGKTIDGNFDLSSPATINFIANPEAIKKFSRFFDTTIALRSPTESTLTINSINITKSFNNFALDGNLQIPLIHLESPENFGQLRSEDLHLDFNIPSLVDPMLVNLNSILNGSPIKASFKGKSCNKEYFELTSPLNINYTLTSETLKLLNVSHLKLIDAAPLILSIKPFKIYYQRPLFEELNISGNSLLHMLEIADPALQKSSTIRRLLLDFDLNIPDNQAAIKLSGRTDAAQEINLNSTIADFISDSHQWSLSDAKINLHGQAANFPVIFFELLLGLTSDYQQHIRTFLGNKFTANTSVELNRMEGNLQLDFQSSKSQLHINSQLADHKISLKEALMAQIKVSPELGDLFLSNINPLLISAINSENPITLKIEPQGFIIPLAPFNMQEVQVKQGQLNLGKLNLKNQGPLGLLIGFLKFQRIHNQDNINLWFTPLDFEINNGLAHYERMDGLVADEFRIATWGNVDLKTNVIDMRLGLPAETLNKAFELPKLSKDYMMQIPMKTIEGSVKIDWSSASKRLGILLAKQKGGDIGRVLGGVFESVNDTAQEDQQPVPPLKYPLPWEQSSSSDTNDKQQDSNDRQPDSDDNSKPQPADIFKELIRSI
ncbi:MAG: hypothetical protein ACQEP8_06570 [Chlamydiota bacterium]